MLSRAILALFWICLSQGILHARWLGMDQLGSQTYLYESSSNTITRYDLASGTGLPSITLPSGHPQMTAACADADGLLVAYGTSVFRYDLSGTNESHVFEAASSVQNLLTDGNLLFINKWESNGATVISLDRTTLATLGTWQTSSGGFSSPTISRSTNTLVFNRYGTSYHAMLPYAEDGTFTEPALPANTDSRSTGTWLWPDGSRYMDTTGTVRGTTHPYPVAGSIGREISAAAIVPGQGMVVISGTTVAAYSEDFALVEQITRAGQPPERLAVHDGKLAIFHTGGPPQFVPLSSLFSPAPVVPPAPEGLAYVPDRIFLSNSGIVHLFSAAHRVIFRWDPVSQSYLGSIPLLGPSLVAYAPATDTIYTAYGSRVVRKIDASAESPREEIFGILTKTPVEMLAVGNHLFTAAEDDSHPQRYVYGYCEILGPDGKPTSSRSSMAYRTNYYWSEATRELYFTDSKNGRSYVGAYPVTPGGVLEEFQGRFGPWAYPTDFYYYGGPVLPSPDGTRVVLGSGVVSAQADLKRLNYQVNAFSSGAWDGANLHTLTYWGSTSITTRSGPTLAYQKGNTLPGIPLGVLPMGGGKLFVATNNGSTVSMYVLDPDLKIIPPATLATPASLTLKLTANRKIELKWADVTGEEHYRIQRRTLPNGPWQTLTTVKVRTFTDENPVSGNNHEYRLTAVNGTLESAPTEPALFRYGPPPAPVATATLALETRNAARVSWQPVPEATTYRVYYSFQPGPGPFGYWQVPGEFPENQTTLVIGNLEPGRTYYYFVFASNALGGSPLSAPAQVSIPQIPPAEPVLRISGDPQPDQINFSWTPDYRAEGYRLERRKAGEVTWVTAAETTSPYQSQITDRTVEALTHYEYRLVGYNEVGDSLPSEMVETTTPDLLLPEVYPFFFQVPIIGTVLPGPVVRMQWADARYETSYLIERRAGSAPWETVASIPAVVELNTVPTWTDLNPVAGTHYTYRVSAVNVKGSVEAGTLRIEAADTPVILADDFEPTADAAVWSDLGGAEVMEGGAPGNHVLRIDGANTREVVTREVDLSMGGRVEFRFRGTAGSTVPLRLEIFWQGFWFWFETIAPDSEGFSEWKSYAFQIDPQGWNPVGRLRITSEEGAAGPAWEIDDLQVTGVLPRSVPEPVEGLTTTDDFGVSAYMVVVQWPAAYGASTYIVERRTAGTSWSVVGEGSEGIFFPGHGIYDGTLPATEYFYRVTAKNPAGAAAASEELRVVTPSAWEEWRYYNYYLAGDTPEAAPLADNGTGIPNLLRFAFNMNVMSPPFPPADADFSGLPVITRDPVSNRLRVAYFRRKAARQPGIDYTVEFSDDCQVWTPGGREVEVIPAPYSYGIMEKVICEDDAPQTAESPKQRFARVRVTQH